MQSDPRLSYFAKTNFRNQNIRFGIKQDDRLAHMHVIGKTGTGKTTLLETLFRQDVEAGRGCALLDPHGDLARRVAEHVPAWRRDDLVYVDLPDPSQPYGYNPLTRVSPDRRSLVASGILELFEKLWPNAWGQRMEYILRNTLLALLELPEATFADILLLYGDKVFRQSVVANISSAQVRYFWRSEYPKYTYRYQAEAIAPIQSKVGAFLADRRLHRFFIKPAKPLRLRQIMDEGRV